MFIESMMKIHAKCTTAILKNPTYLRKLVYKYNSGDKEEEYIFFNNMYVFCILRMTKDDHACSEGFNRNYEE